MPRSQRTVVPYWLVALFSGHSVLSWERVNGIEQWVESSCGTGPHFRTSSTRNTFLTLDSAMPVLSGLLGIK